MIKNNMRHAMAMIELIFAIVVIAISIISIPMMVAVADKASKGVIIDDDVMSRLSGWTLDKFQARWDGNYSASNSGALVFNPDSGDLNCTRDGMYRWGSDENVSSMQCNMLLNPSAIPASGSGVLADGIEQLNGGSETLAISATYDVNASYAVSYVDSTVAPLSGSNTQTATWRLGSSNIMSPSASATSTHLKRVVTRFRDTETSTDIVLTFFKSNKGN
jgi:X-X-X-Leu-X-X-Gly heptad repeat protein